MTTGAPGPTLELAVPAEQPVRLLHVTDTHLLADRDAELKGIAPWPGLLRCARHAADQGVRGAAPDLIVATGDLAHEGEREAYALLAGALAGQGAPLAGVPGNHDAPEVLAALLIEPPCTPARRIRAGAWEILLLDSHLPGEEAGALGPAGLAALASALAEPGPRHRLIALHHPPFAVGSPWIDRISLLDADDFWSTLDGSVRAVLAGHVHQDFDRRARGCRQITSPSTWAQFAPRQDVFMLDDRPPGYRWLELQPDGTIETAACYVP